MKKKINVLKDLANVKQPILSDESLGLEFYYYRHLPEEFILLDKVYTDELKELSDEKDLLGKEIDALVDSKTLDNHKEVSAEIKELNQRIDEIDSTLDKLNLYQLAPMCKLKVEELTELIKEKVDDDASVLEVALQLRYHYSAAIKAYVEEEKKKINKIIGIEEEKT
jgi:hypothetical protein